jgi:hypothetical protein
MHCQNISFRDGSIFKQGEHEIIGFSVTDCLKGIAQGFTANSQSILKQHFGFTFRKGISLKRIG